MPASVHDQRLVAVLVPLTDEVQSLVRALQHFCSDLSTGHADSAQREDVDQRCAEVVEHLQQLRQQVIPTVPGLVLDDPANST